MDSIQRHKYVPTILGLMMLMLTLSGSLRGENGSTAEFTRIEVELLGQDTTNAAGSAWVDYDNDGDLDLFLVTRDIAEPNYLFRNDEGSFTQVLDNAIVLDFAQSSACTWADYDNDGNIDLFVANESGVNFLYRNLGNGDFERIEDGSSIVTSTQTTIGAAWADFNNDGYVDIALANGMSQHNQLFVNLGNGAFEEIVTGPVVTSFGESRAVIWADYDNDGDADLYITNALGSNNFFYENDGEGGFTAVTKIPIVQDESNSRSASWGDYDNDGYLDLLVTNTGGENNFLYRNTGNKSFEQISDTVVTTNGGQSWGSSFADYNNDGFLDIAVSNATNEDNFLYQNQGDGTFCRVVNSTIVNESGQSKASIWGDIDQDGDLDVFISNGSDSVSYLYRNDTKTDPAIEVQLVGTNGNQNAIGARVTLVSNLDGGSALSRQVREITAQSGAFSQSVISAWFGLGESTGIDSLIVRWPGGQVQTLTDVHIQSTLTIVEERAAFSFTTSFLDTTASRGISWADIDSDGYEDIFISNGDGQTNSVWRNLGNGTFESIEYGVLTSPGGESTSSAWVDYDNDGNLDVFVSNTHGEDNFLYLSDGAGNYSLSASAITTSSGNSQTGSWVDYDRNGFVDLFVSNFLGETNQLFSNNGGVFTEVEDGHMVITSSNSTGGAWADYDLDGWSDLFVPNNGDEDNFLYHNDGAGGFTLVESGAIVSDGGFSVGASWADYDNDGDLDLFVPNSETSPNFLYENKGAAGFERVINGDAVTDALSTSGSAWGDLDNDGDLDLVVINQDFTMFAYQNTGGNAFVRVDSVFTNLDSVPANIVALADYDHDGDLDMAIATRFEEVGNMVLRNDGNENSGISVRLHGQRSNRVGMGAHITVVADVAGTPTSQLRVVQSQSGTLAQSSLRPHFGIGDAVILDTVKIEWPNGLRQFDKNVSASNGQVLDYTELWVNSSHPTDVSFTSVRLNGEAIPGERGADILFEFGPTPEMGFIVAADGTPHFGEEPVDVSVEIQDLAFGATYYYRIVAVFNDEWAYNQPDSFATLDLPPYPETYTVEKIIDFPQHTSASDFDVADYRIFGLPGDATEIRVEEVLSGVAGSDWQVFWDNGASGDNPDNYLIPWSSSIEFRFEPGRAFWLVHQGTWEISGQVVPTQQLNGWDEVAISLHEGWNLITNPFDTAIEWSRIDYVYGGGLQPIWHYDGGFDSTQAMFEPYTGYYFYNGNGLVLDSLHIPYETLFIDPAGATNNATDRSWTASVLLTSDDARVQKVSFGIDDQADALLDAQDAIKPRNMGKTSRLYFLQADISGKSWVLASDIHSQIERFAEWDLVVAADPTAAGYILSFENLHAIPDAHAIILYEPAGAVAHDLRTVSSVAIAARTSSSEYKLFVGELESINEKIDALVPTEFRLLPNYPNPFNPNTTIAVQLPSHTILDLAIYNVLGQQVHSLHHGEMAAGHHKFSWDGSNDLGIGVSSGIYFIRLTTEAGKRMSQKMILMK